MKHRLLFWLSKCQMEPVGNVNQTIRMTDGTMGYFVRAGSHSALLRFIWSKTSNETNFIQSKYSKELLTILLFSSVLRTSHAYIK